MRMVLNEGDRLKVEGPASVMLREGDVSILGKKLRVREQVTIAKSKIVLLEAEAKSIVEVNLGDEGKIEKIEDPVVPYEWRVAAENILKEKMPIKVIVLGGVDTGKNAFTTYLSNLAIARKLRVLVIDEDLGQSEFSPPTTIGMALIKRAITSLSRAKSMEMYFVGSTNPMGVIHRVMIGIKHLLEKAEQHGYDILIINTDGWVYGDEARDFKLGIIEVVRPDIIVAIQRVNEIEHLLMPFTSQKWVKIIRLLTPPSFKQRTLEDRKLIRESMYRKVFSNSRIVKTSLEDVSIMYSFYASSFPLNKSDMHQLVKILGEEPIYGGRIPEGLVLVLKRAPDEQKLETIKSVFNVGEIKVIRCGMERGIIAGLYDSNGNFVGLGVIKEIDYRKRIVKLLVNTENEIAMIKLGKIKLDENFRERAKIPLWYI